MKGTDERNMDLVIALTINGLVWGLIIALIALGLSIIFGLLDIINVAHGDFFMIGTVAGFVVAERTGFLARLGTGPDLRPPTRLADGARCHPPEARLPH